MTTLRNAPLARCLWVTYSGQWIWWPPGQSYGKVVSPLPLWMLCMFLIFRLLPEVRRIVCSLSMNFMEERFVVNVAGNQYGLGPPRRVDGYSLILFYPKFYDNDPIYYSVATWYSPIYKQDEPCARKEKRVELLLSPLNLLVSYSGSSHVRDIMTIYSRVYSVF